MSDKNLTVEMMAATLATEFGRCAVMTTLKQLGHGDLIFDHDPLVMAGNASRHDRVAMFINYLNRYFPGRWEQMQREHEFQQVARKEQAAEARPREDDILENPHDD